MKINLKDNAIISIDEAGYDEAGGFCETCYYEEWVDAVEVEFLDGTSVTLHCVSIKPFLDFVFTGLENGTLRNMTEKEFIEEARTK